MNATTTACRARPALNNPRTERGSPARHYADRINCMAFKARLSQIQLTGTAGTVVVFNSHLWHGGTQNRTDKPRRALHSYFALRHLPQQLDQQAYLRVETYKRLTPAQRFILDVTGRS